MSPIPTLTRQQTAALLRVSERYLVDVILSVGGLKPLDGTDGMLFDEAEVMAYRDMDIQRRREALRKIAEGD